MIRTKTGHKRRRAGVALLIGAVLVVAGCEDSEVPSTSPVPSPQGEAGPAPQIPQADWKMKTRPVGRVGKLSKKQKRRHRAQRKQVKSVVREVYTALFLEPDSIREVISDRFTRRAGRALLRAEPGFRPSAENVRTFKRQASIGLQAHPASAAAAEVLVKARAKGPGSIVRLSHRATMWMQRVNGRWRVIGFELDQERVG